MTTTDLARTLGEVDAAQRAGTEVTPRGQTIFDKIRGRRTMYDAVLRTVDPERFVSIAVKASAKVAACTEESILGCIMLSAQLNLEPGTVLQHAHLVPYGRECTFIVDYRGYVELARRAGYAVSAEAVFEGDEFDVTLGLDRNIVHRPTGGDRADYSKLTHVYAVAQSINDPAAPKQFVVLTKAEVEVTRKRARSQNGPWKTDPIPMAVKTSVRRLAKWMPLAIEVAQAAQVDGAVPTSSAPSLDDFDPDVIDVRGTAPAAAQLSPSASDADPPPATPQPVSTETSSIVEALETEADSGSAGTAEGLAGHGAMAASDPADPEPDAPLTVQQHAIAAVFNLPDGALADWDAYQKKHVLVPDPNKWTDRQANGVIEFAQNYGQEGGE